MSCCLRMADAVPPPRFAQSASVRIRRFFGHRIVLTRARSLMLGLSWREV
jgi:hypothetical protein